MPTNFKKKVQKRMADTGESWATAQKAVRDQVPSTPQVENTLAAAVANAVFAGPTVPTDPKDPAFRGSVVRLGDPNITFTQDAIRTPLSPEAFAAWLGEGAVATTTSTDRNGRTVRVGDQIRAHTHGHGLCHANGTEFLGPFPSTTLRAEPPPWETIAYLAYWNEYGWVASNQTLTPDQEAAARLAPSEAVVRFALWSVCQCDTQPAPGGTLAVEPTQLSVSTGNNAISVRPSRPLVVYVNGRPRSLVTVPNDATEEEVRRLVAEDAMTLAFTKGRVEKKFTHVPKVMISIIVTPSGETRRVKGADGFYHLEDAMDPVMDPVDGGPSATELHELRLTQQVLRDIEPQVPAPQAHGSTEAQRLLRLDEIRPIKTAAAALVARLMGKDGFGDQLEGPLAQWDLAVVALSIAPLEDPVRAFREACVNVGTLRKNPPVRGRLGDAGKSPESYRLRVAAIASGAFVPYVWSPAIVALWKRANACSPGYEEQRAPGQVNYWDRDGFRRLAPINIAHLRSSTSALDGWLPFDGVTITQEEIDTEYAADAKHDHAHWDPIFDKAMEVWRDAERVAVDASLVAYRALSAAMDRALAE